MKILYIKQFLQQNWFRLLLIGVIVLLGLKKEISFQIDLKGSQEGGLVSKNALFSFDHASIFSKNDPEVQPTKTAVKKINAKKLVQESVEPALTTLIPNFKQIDKEEIVAFLRRFGHVAINERNKYGVPASVILANGLVLSQAGRNEWSQQGNSFFAIPCTSDWEGEQGNYAGRCMRHYQNAWTSFRDHSLYLTTGKFSALKQFDTKDYKSWAKALQEGNFYPSKGFDRFIIETIKAYKLYQFDRD